MGHMISIVFISVEFVFVIIYETMNSVISFIFVSVEFVLAITGATMGSMISFIFVSVEFVLAITGATMGSMISCIFVSVEFVLAITGATMGSMISFIFPAIMFISVMSISQSKFVAQVRFLHAILTALVETCPPVIWTGKPRVRYVEILDGKWQVEPQGATVIPNH